MVAEKTKKMPKGVGKRIIQSLKNKELGIDIEENFDNELEDKIKPAIMLEEPEEIEEESEEIQEQEFQDEEIECEADYSTVETQTRSFTCTPKAQQLPPISDIDTLLNLISKLPSGVTKQTGALIIRQTMEAMGISMNNVLSNAQSVQEGLENSIRNNVNIIEEYRTKIKILEQEIQKFRKKAHELEDIISLFILSEDKKGI